MAAAAPKNWALIQYFAGWLPPKHIAVRHSMTLKPTKFLHPRHKTPRACTKVWQHYQHSRRTRGTKDTILELIRSHWRKNCTVTVCPCSTAGVDIRFLDWRLQRQNLHKAPSQTRSYGKENSKDNQFPPAFHKAILRFWCGYDAPTTWVCDVPTTWIIKHD